MLKTALIISLLMLLPIAGYASDSLLTVRDVMTRTCYFLAIDTLGTDLIDSVTLKRFVYDGAIRAYTDLGSPKVKKIELSSGTNGYFIDDGLILISGAVLDSNRSFTALQQVRTSMLNDLNYYSNITGTLERPRYYIRHGDSIFVYPPPVDTDTITVYYYGRGTFPDYGDPRSDTVLVDIPLEYRIAVVYATTIYCEIRRGNYDRVGLFEDLYMKEVARLRSRFEFEGKDLEK